MNNNLMKDQHIKSYPHMMYFIKKMLHFQTKSQLQRNKYKEKDGKNKLNKRRLSK